MFIFYYPFSGHFYFSALLQSMPQQRKRAKHHHEPNHKQRLGELVEEDDGMFVSFHTKEGNVHNEYDTSKIRTAKAPERVIQTPPILSESPSKKKVNNTIVRIQILLIPYFHNKHSDLAS